MLFQVTGGGRRTAALGRFSRWSLCRSRVHSRRSRARRLAGFRGFGLMPQSALPLDLSLRALRPAKLGSKPTSAQRDRAKIPGKGRSPSSRTPLRRRSCSVTWPACTRTKSSILRAGTGHFRRVVGCHHENLRATGAAGRSTACRCGGILRRWSHAQIVGADFAPV
jgi:hypothetical protein